MPLEGQALELVLEGVGSFFVTYFFAVGISTFANAIVLAGLIYFSNQAGYPTMFNPAVTFMQLLCGRLGEGMKDWKTLLKYWGVQFAAAVPAAILGYATRPDDNVVACPGKMKYFNIVEAFLNEYLWSIALCYVFVIMFFEKELKGNGIYGLVLGFQYMVAGMSGSISGGTYNPAMATGLWFSSSFMKPSGNDCFVDGFGYLFYFLLAPLCGAATAWGLHKLLDDERFAKFHDLGMEFVGTFFITLAAGLAILDSSVGSYNFHAAGALQTVGGGLAVGTCIAIWTYVGAYKNSGFYNPVFSIMSFVNGGISAIKFGLLSAAQCGGSFLAALVAYLITRYGSGDGQDALDAGVKSLEPYRPRAASNVNKFGALLAEFFATFFVGVMFMAIMARVHKSGRNNNPLYGLMVGWGVTAANLTVGAYTYSYFNPAIWVGTSFIYLFAEGGDDFGEIYIYAISGFGGAIAASFFYKFMIGNPFEGPGFDSEEGRALREREEYRREAETRRGRAASSTASGGAGGAGAGSNNNSKKAAATTQPAAGTDGKPADNAV